MSKEGHSNEFGLLSQNEILSRGDFSITMRKDHRGSYEKELQRNTVGRSRWTHYEASRLSGDTRWNQLEPEWVFESPRWLMHRELHRRAKFKRLTVHNGESNH